MLPLNDPCLMRTRCLVDSVWVNTAETGRGINNAARAMVGRKALTAEERARVLRRWFVMFDDADLEAALAGPIASKFRSTGPTCVGVNPAGMGGLLTLSA